MLTAVSSANIVSMLCLSSFTLHQPVFDVIHKLQVDETRKLNKHYICDLLTSLVTINDHAGLFVLGTKFLFQNQCFRANMY